MNIWIERNINGLDVLLEILRGGGINKDGNQLVFNISLYNVNSLSFIQNSPITNKYAYRIYNKSNSADANYLMFLVNNQNYSESYATDNHIGIPAYNIHIHFKLYVPTTTVGQQFCNLLFNKNESYVNSDRNVLCMMKSDASNIQFSSWNEKGSTHPPTASCSLNKWNTFDWYIYSPSSMYLSINGTNHQIISSNYYSCYNYFHWIAFAITYKNNNQTSDVYLDDLFIIVDNTNSYTESSSIYYLQRELTPYETFNNKDNNIYGI